PISGVVQNLSRFFWIVRIGLYLGVISPTLRRQNACRRLRESAPDVLDQRTAIDGIGNGLAYPNIFQGWITKVECRIGENRAGSALDIQPGFLSQRQHGIGGE